MAKTHKIANTFERLVLKYQLRTETKRDLSLIILTDQSPISKTTTNTSKTLNFAFFSEID